MINYIFPHLGLGDYLVVNGLIRSIIKSDQQYILFTNKNYEESIKFMFRDIPNLAYKVIPQLFYNRYTILPYIDRQEYNLMVIGYEQLYLYMRTEMSSDKSFYKQYNVPFENRWKKFYVERDLEKEKTFFNTFNINKEYAFVHDDPKRNQEIRKTYIDSNLQIIKALPELTNNIFDYCYIIENAKEVHCIESCFMLLTDSLNPKGTLVSHRYTKSIHNDTLPSLNKKWKIL